MVLKLEKDKQIYSFDVDDINKGEKLYYKFQINTSTLPDGKYSLTLYDDENIIAEDVLYIGNFIEKALQYTKGENIYINSPFSANIEPEKSAEISNTIVTIYPSSEYDGMASVKVNASAVYQNGYNSGNMAGYETGKREQKALLEKVTITENGTYSREDGYSEVTVNVEDTNGSYDDGYKDGYNEGLEFGTENAGAAVAETAQVLETTIEGTYTTKYSKPEDITEEITGDFGDGTYFYSYATMEKKFNTYVHPTANTVLEIWWKRNDEVVLNYDRGDVIIGAQYTADARGIYKLDYNVFTEKFNFEYNGVKHTFKVDNPYLFNHFYFSKENGIWVNGEFIMNIDGDFVEHPSQSPFYINGLEYSAGYSSNGDFGMVKIDNNIFIPKEDGFINYNTNEKLIDEKPDKIYSYFSPVVETNGNLIRTVVNRPKINVGQYDIKLSYSDFEEVPDIFDFSNTTKFRYMFNFCQNLKTIPMIDTSLATNLEYMFNYCQNLLYIPNIDISKATSINNMFNTCQRLQYLPELNTSNVVNASGVFASCQDLTSLPPLNFGKLNMSNYQGLFSNVELPKLVDIGGFIDLKTSLTYTYNLKKCPNLTYQSCINILNGLYDFTGNGETPTSAQGQLSVHQNFLNLIGDEISIATNKGWIITA